MASPTEPRWNWIYPGALVLVFGAALAIRLACIPHQEPIVLHPDEREFVERALRILATFDFNPHWFGHPGSFTIYSLSAVFAVSAKAQGQAFGNLLELYEADPAPFHLVGKSWITAWSLLGHGATWLLARHFVGRPAALISVLILACAPLDIGLATTVRTDTQQTVLLVFLAWLLVRTTQLQAQSQRLRAFAAAGALLGLAVAVKWPSLVACLSICLAAVLHRGPGSNKVDWKGACQQIAVAAGASLVGLFVGAPYVLLDFGTVLSDVAREARTEHLGATSAGFFSALAYYLKKLWLAGAAPGVVLAVAGVVAGLRGPRWREHAVALSLFAIYLPFISSLSLRWPRWALPLVPFVAVYAGVGAEFVAERLSRLLPPATGRRPSAWIGASVGLIVALGSGQRAAHTLMDRSRDPQVPATAWVIAHIPRGAKILVESGAPYLPNGRYAVYEVHSEGEAVRVRGKSKYHAPDGRFTHLKHPEEALKEVDYVFLGDGYARVKADEKRYQKEARIYEKLLLGTKRLARFGTADLRETRKTQRNKAKSSPASN